MSDRSFKLVIITAIGISAWVWWQQREKKKADQGTNRTIAQPSGVSQPYPAQYPGGFLYAPADYNGTNVVH